MNLAQRLRWLRTRARRLFRRSRQEAELDAEMQFHFDQLVAEFRAEGLNERDARRAAQREFGTVDAYREEVRDTWRPPQLGEAWRSLATATRSLIRTPGFTILAIVTLGLGIGANTAMFSVVNGVALKPLPYRDPASLDYVFRQTASNPKGPFSAPDFNAFRTAATGTYAEVAGMAYREVSLAEPGAPAEFADGMRVSANFLALLGLPPVRGRDFRASDDAEGAEPVAILSDRLWHNRFGGRADIIGHTVRLNGRPHTIIGVLPERFNDWRHLGWVDLFTPLALTGAQQSERDNAFIEILARRAPGVSAETASAFVATWGEQQVQDYPEVHAASSCYTTNISAIVTDFDARITLTMLLGLSGFVVLIACSNLANLLLARTMARAREFAVRSALGASRRQLLQPLLLEALLLALAGGILALLAAAWSNGWMQMRSTADNGEQVVFAMDWSVMGWAFVCSLATAIIFGVAPALFALRLNLNATLKSGARGATGGRGHQRLRHLLIVGQFALAMVLLSGSALFINGLSDLNDRRTGWDSKHLVTGSFLLPDTRYGSPSEINAFQERALEQLRALPGVDSAGFSVNPPFFTWGQSARFLVEGQTRPERGREPAALVNAVTPHYLSTVGTRLLSGRDFDARDQADSTPAVIINAAMASALFGTNNPIGQRIATVSGDEELTWAEIVGVAADVRNTQPEIALIPYQVYTPMTQTPSAANEIAVRTAGVEPATQVEAIRAVFGALDADLPLRNLKSADDRVARANYQLGVLRDMLTGFAILGLTLAAIGIYGVITRTMAQRQHEFGIRLALGAQVRDITRIVLGAGIRLSITGAALGVLGGIGLARLLQLGFPNMNLDNPGIVVAATLLLVVVALLACYLPARRAARINPVDSLRAE